MKHTRIVRTAPNRQASSTRTLRMITFSKKLIITNRSMQHRRQTSVIESIHKQPFDFTDTARKLLHSVTYSTIKVNC